MLVGSFILPEAERGRVNPFENRDLMRQLRFGH
jgi:hypothetical protein